MVGWQPLSDGRYGSVTPSGTMARVGMSIDKCQRAATALVSFLLSVACGLSHVVAAERHIAAAAGHICVVQASGGVACIGNTTTTGKLMPPTGVAFHAVTLGDDFSCGLTAVTSSLLCWGALPGGTSQLPAASTFFVDVHAGPRHICGLAPNGIATCYGDATSRGAINAPPGVVFQSVTAGANYTCGVVRNHSVACWGDATNPVVAAAATWQAITDAEHVAAGVDHACYVRVNGSVACWGSNSRGAAVPPDALTSNGSVWWLAAGGGMTCAMSGFSAPGQVTCWGAVSGNMTSTGYEVACAGWGCVASAPNNSIGSGSGGNSGNGRVVVAAAVNGSPLPQAVCVGDCAVMVTTVAGGTSGYLDGVGTTARFQNPNGGALDGTGGLYVADYGNHVIRRMDIAARNITTVAGVAGSNGATFGATPLQSTFYNPRGVEVDGVGNVYVADTGNNAIRMLSGAWVAGSTSGTPGSANAAAGTSALFYSPYIVRADATVGLLYVADTYNNKVRTIATNGTNAVATLTTYSTYVRDIALNPAARIMYVAVSNSVYLVTYAGASTLLAGDANNASYADGVGSAARFNYVCGLALDAAAGVLYVADESNNRIRRITTADGVVTTIAGSGSFTTADGFGTGASFVYPWGLSWDVITGALYNIGLYGVIRRVQIQPPAVAIAAVAPLPPSPLAPTHQLTAWRALGSAASGTNMVHARNATFALPLAATNTAGLNPTVNTLLLGNVTLTPRNATPASAGNTNTTFSTSAQRSLRLLTLTTGVVPVASLALPALTNLTLGAPVATQPLQLTNDSFMGLAALTTLAVSNVNNISWPYLAWLTALPSRVSLDLSGNAISAVDEHDFDAAQSLRWLSLANTTLTYVSDAAFSAAKQPALAVLDQSRTPLATGSGCRPGSSNVVQPVPTGGAPYIACSTCPAGTYCSGGARSPIQCGVNTYAAGGAAVCALCPAGTYAPGATKECIACPPRLSASGCNATASWRDSITVVADGAGAWVNASIYLAPAGAIPSTANVSCGPLAVVSTTTVSCALPFLLPAAATAPLLTTVWVAHAGTGGAVLPLNATVMLMPSPPVVVAPGGGLGLAQHAPGTGRIVLRLPAPRLAAADWTAVGWQPPAQASIDSLAVWVGGVPCTDPSWESSTTLSCTTAATDATNLAAVVQLAGGMFNVSGVLPSLLLPALALGGSTELPLLPPALGATTSVINITLSGVSLCMGGVPQLAAASVAGVPCAAVACVVASPDTMVCVGWNASNPAAAALHTGGGSPQTTANVTVSWVNPATRPVTCTTCVTLATRPVLVSITPTSIAAPGVPVVVTGSGITDATRAPPTVIIGGEVCSGVVVLSQTVVQCNAPVIQASAPGYPVVSVMVVNAVGAASTEPITLTYPVTFAVSWAATPTLAALPGGLLVPAPVLRVLSRQAAACSLTVNVTSCATNNPALASRPAGMTVTSPPSSLAVGASSSSNATTDLLLDALTVGGASSCVGVLTAVCIDAVGQAASTVGQPNPTVVLTGWRADWNASSIPAAPFIVVPESLPQVAAIVIVDGGNVSTASLSCLALLAPASATPPPLSQSLDRVSSRDMLSSVTGAVALANGSAAGIAFSGLTASAARLGQALAVYAECTWVPTGERVRLPTLSLAVANASLALTPATSLLVEAYESASVAATAMLSPAGVATFAGAAAACTWRAGAATTSSLVLAASTVASTWTLDADGAVVGGQPLALTVDGPPSATLTLQLVCSLWGGNTVASPPFNVTTTTYAMALRGGGGAGTLRAVWPSGTQAVLPLAPALDVAAPARGVLTCSVEVTSVVLPPLAATPGVGLGLADTAVQLVGEPSVSVSLASAATHANVSLPRVGLRAPSGTNASLVLTCRDGVGRSAALGALLNVSVAALSASWSAGTVSSMPSVVVPSQALPSLTLTLASTPAVPLPPNADVGSLVTCVAALVRASMSLPLGTPLATLLAAAPPYASVSTINMALGADNASIVITLPSLSTVACPLSTPLMVAAECTWTPTGERLRLPSLTTATLPLSASWVSPPTAVLGYSAVPLRMVATLLAPASAGATASAQCDVVLLNATARGVSVLADAWVMGVDASAPAGTTIAANVDVTLQAPPGATVFVQASCEVWGQAFDTPPLRLTAATLALQLLSGVPASFIASDASSPWPLDPPLSLRVVTNDGAVVTDVSCAVATSTPGAEFKVIGSSVSLQSVSAHGATGVVDVPPFVVQTAPTTEAIDATAECRRSSGDAPQPLTFTVPAIKLHTELCNTPQSTSEVGTPLPSFGVGIVTVAANGSVHNPCNAATPTMSLPPIVCTISLNASATTTNDTSSIFLQHTLTTIAAATHRAAFDAFTLVAPQGETYGLSLACAVGGLAIPPALPFAVALAGCRAGQESVSVACVTCGGGAFSLGGMGAQCKECPSVGASCNEGIITLLPHYF